MIGARFEVNGRTYTVAKAKTPGACEGCHILEQENNGVPCAKGDAPCHVDEVLKLQLVG